MVRVHVTCTTRSVAVFSARSMFTQNFITVPQLHNSVVMSKLIFYWKTWRKIYELKILSFSFDQSALKSALDEFCEKCHYSKVSFIHGSTNSNGQPAVPVLRFLDWYTLVKPLIRDLNNHPVNSSNKENNCWCNNSCCEKRFFGFFIRDSRTISE